jgi:hypothetical protein
VHNNQRDGMHRQAIARGRVAYEPNSLGGGCPFQAGMKGFAPSPSDYGKNNEPIDKVRGKPEKFAEHYNQAALFWESQTPSVLYDAVIVPAGALAAQTLGMIGQAPEFIKDQYRHCKPMLVLGEGVELLQKAQIPQTLPSGEEDPGLIIVSEGITKNTLDRFAQAVAKHRHFERALDPPPI